MNRATLALALLLPLTAWGAPEDDVTADETLAVEIKNVTDEEGNPAGCFFSVKGKTEPLADGTRLEVTFAACGRSQNFSIKVLRAVVKKNAYEVSSKWPDRQFAPLLYEVKVVLNVRKQNKKVQQWIMQEYGYAITHQEILDRKRLSSATPDERASFALQNLERIMGFVRQLDSVRGEVVAASATPAPESKEWPDLELRLNESIVAFRDELDAYFKRYVKLLEQGFYSRLLSYTKQLARVIRDHGRNVPGIPERLDLLGRELAATIELIKEHSPVMHEEALIPDDEEEQGEPEKPEKPGEQE